MPISQYNARMRKVILAAGITLDGYIARPDGAVDYLFMPKDFSMAPFFASIDTIVMGRKTYEVSLQMGGGSFGTQIASYVLSRARTPGGRDGVIFVNEPVAELASRLRAGSPKGKHIWLMGGGEIAREFLLADLVDEIHLSCRPDFRNAISSSSGTIHIQEGWSNSNTSGAAASARCPFPCAAMRSQAASRA